ncbi:MAG: protein kinase [Verrucomicrobiaceae bacterium]|nr:MAG: protein kinase [Verrucomicrobiaceae bacterium]
MDTLEKLRSGELAGARRLDLSCGLTEFPREILDLAETLEILNLSGNQLCGLPEDFGKLHKLRIFFCSDNAFTHLPAALGSCPQLEMIGFKANRIKTIDPAAFPPRLRWLILTDNCIRKLPSTIGRCHRLQKLMLAGNHLARLPDEMAACTALQLVRLAANRFKEFPGWLFELPCLAWLALGGNPWERAAESVAMEEIPFEELEIGSLLGEGASGHIYQGSWNGDEVAVKIFKGGMTSDGLPDSEMSACLAAGNHPGLIGALGRISNHPEDRHGLVMPLVDPGFTSLAGPPDFDSCTRDIYAPDFRLSPTQVLRAARDLSSAALHLHERGVLHGDFYAHNILRNPDGGCLLGDFGAATLLPPGAPVERIEVLAFGILLGELLERTEGECPAEIVKIQQRCLAGNVASRPDFREITGALEIIAAVAL